MTAGFATNAKDFGARGDGTGMDTAALQAAIDACAKAGGGRVLLPPGRYPTGTLWLKSGVHLYVAAGATLAGVGERSQYNADDAFPENNVFSQENVTGAHLIIAREAEDVGICGEGTIDGGSHHFFDIPEGEPKPYSYTSKKGVNYTLREWRPGQMIFFIRCKRVKVRDVTLLNAPYWTLFCHGCDDVAIRGLTVTNPPRTPNGDGIDIDCCRNVTISDCRLATGDDCITLRGSHKRLPAPKPCENVTVTNCVLSSPCCAIRVGVGDGIVRRCALSNIVVDDARTGINFISRYSQRAGHGVDIRDISCTNFVMNCVLPIHAYLGGGATPPAAIEDIRLSGFTVRATAGMYVGGTPEAPVRRFALSDWDVVMDGGTDCEDYCEEVPFPFPTNAASGLEGKPALPCALFARHVEGLRLTDFRLRWGGKLGRVWRDSVGLRDVRGVLIRESSLPPPRQGGASLRSDRAEGVVVRESD